MGKDQVMVFPSAQGPTALILQCSPDTATLKQIRSEIRRWLQSRLLPLGAWDLVATELMCNAIAANTRGSVEIKMTLINDAEPPRIVCSVTNQGVWDLKFTERAAAIDTVRAAAIDSVIDRTSRPIDTLPSGRGLRLIRALTTGGEVKVTDERTCVTVWLDLPSDERSLGASVTRTPENWWTLENCCS